MTQLNIEFGTDEKCQHAISKAKKIISENINTGDYYLRKINNKERWHFARRVFNYEVDWTYYFICDADEAQALINSGLATYW